MNPDFQFRNLKALEIQKALEEHYGNLEPIGTQLYQLKDGRKLVFYYATGSDWYSPTVERLEEQLQAEDLVVFAYTDEEAAHLWVFAVPVDTLLERMRDTGVEPTLSGGTKYSLNLEDADGFKLRQLDLSLAEYQIVSQPTDLTRAMVGLAEPSADLLAQAAPLNAQQLQRLLWWKMDGREERGQDFNFADIRRRLNAIRAELQLLSDRPQEFTEASWKTVLDHMHSAQRQKNNILQDNEMDHVRRELRAFLMDSDTDLERRFERFQRELRGVGASIAGELISWYDPDQYPLENAADRAGLRYFGFSPGSTYVSFLSAFADFRQVYERIIGRLQPDLPLNLEIDQLFNQIHKFDLRQTDDEETDSSDESAAQEAYWRITLPDQGDMSTIWPTCRDKGIAAIGFRDDDGNWQVRKFARIKVGDWIIAFLREKRIGGIGLVTKAYDRAAEVSPEEDYWDGDHCRRIGVRWYVRPLNVEELSPATRNKFIGQTIQELSRAEFLEVRQHYEDLLPETPTEDQPVVEYTVDDFVRRTFQRDAQAYNEMVELLTEKGQIILYGPPGTGKTYIARELAKAMTGFSEPGLARYRLVQFHLAYSYEEFIEGIRPESVTRDGRTMVEYPIRDGVFKRFCIDAGGQGTKPCVFVIDEINRGNIASIFGELMYALEYRDQSAPVVLPYSGQEFVIPENVHLIGTMNTADRSISLMDFALRRRFHFVRCRADPAVLQRWAENRKITLPYLVPVYLALIDAIKEEDFQIGMSYFMDDALTEERLRRIWRRSIEPYLETYFIDDPGRVEPLRWESDRMRELRRQYRQEADA